MNISETIKRQLEMQMSMIEVHERLGDGKPHELTFIDAIFLDGASMVSDAHQPLVLTQMVTGVDEFQAAMNDLMDRLTSAYRTAITGEMLPVIATSRAGIIFALEVQKGEQMNEQVAADAMNILGAGSALSEMGLLDRCGLSDLETNAKFREYLEKYPAPKETPL